MDNVTNIEPADNEERLLKGILEGDTETNIEPAGNKERLLKGILEKLGGGGGATSVTLAASGDNLSGDISLADLKTALSNGVVLLSFPTDGNADERVVAEYTDDSTNGLRIGVFSEDEYIVYSVVDNGNDGVTLTVVSSKKQGGIVITPSMAEQQSLMGDITSFVTQAVQSGGYTVYQVQHGYLSLVSAVKQAQDDGYTDISINMASNYIKPLAIGSQSFQIMLCNSQSPYVMDVRMWIGDDFIVITGSAVHE